MRRKENWKKSNRMNGNIKIGYVFARKGIMDNKMRERMIDNMLCIGDTVKVIAATKSHWNPEEKTEYIKIGTICKVTSVEYEENGNPYYEIRPIYEIGCDRFYYLEEELEKGELRWIKETNDLKTEDVERALLMVRKMKDSFARKSGKPVSKKDYERLCKCEESALITLLVINMINHGKFE